MITHIDSQYNNISTAVKFMVYNDFLKGESFYRMKIKYNLSKPCINKICVNTFTKDDIVIQEIKDKHIEQEGKVFDIVDFACMSSLQITVGDCIIENNKIIDFKHINL